MTASKLRCGHIFLWTCLMPLGLALSAATALASPLEVAPVHVVLAAGHDTTSLTLSNPSRKPETFQIRAFRWTQGRGGNRLRPTGELEFSPPMGSLAPGARQIVRLRVRRAPRAVEASFRLLIDQLPPPAAAGKVAMVLRLSLPVFQEPQVPVAPRVSWRALRAGGHLWLLATNAGGRHAVFHDLHLHGTACGTQSVRGGQLAYVLAHSRRRWRIACHAAAALRAGPLRLSMLTLHGFVTIPVRRAARKR